MTKSKISVIIPLYNAERFIRQCLISVLASKFQDYEVIVVDDCSTDNSVAEVLKLAPHFDGRLKLLHTETNSGSPGLPRNIGIRHAAGEYVTFVDNDDMILPTALDDFFDAAEKFQADVVHTVKAYVFSDAGGKMFSRADLQLQSDNSDDHSDTPRLETEDLRERMKDYFAEKYFWLPWGKFYRRDFLLNNEIDFPQVKFSEDMVFCFKCLCLAKNYLRVPFVTNIHRLLKNSASKSGMNSREGIKWWLSVVTVVVQAIDKFTGQLTFFRDNPDVRRDALKFFVDQHFGFIKKLFRSIPAHELQKIFYDELQNPALDSHGKNLIAACLFTQRALRR